MKKYDFLLLLIIFSLSTPHEAISFGFSSEPQYKGQRPMTDLSESRKMGNKLASQFLKTTMEVTSAIHREIRGQYSDSREEVLNYIRNHPLNIRQKDHYNEADFAFEYIRSALEKTGKFTPAQAEELTVDIMSQYSPKETLSLPSVHRGQVPSGDILSKSHFVAKDHLGTVTSRETLGAAIKEMDPYYAKMLLPGQINYSEIFANVDAAKPTRSKIAKEHIARVEYLMSAGVDQYGVLKIKGPASQTATFDNGHIYASSSHWEDPQAYVNAIKSSFNEIVGVKVGGAGKYTYSSFSFTDHVVSSTSTSVKGSGMVIYVVPDINAEAKVEILKAKFFKNLEEQLSAVRQAVFGNWQKDEMAMRALVAILRGKTNPEEIREELEFSQGSLSVFRLALQKATPEEILNNLPENTHKKVRYLEQSILLLGECEKQAAKAQNYDEAKSCQSALSQAKNLLRRAQ